MRFAVIDWRPFAGLAAAIALSACSVLPEVGSDTPSIEAALVEDNPVAFAKDFVALIQPGVSFTQYEKLLHPNIRDMLKGSPHARASYFGKAQRENAFIEPLNVFENAWVERHPQQFNDQIHVWYQLPEGAESTPLEEVYPESALAGRGRHLSKGQVVLVEAEGGWRVVWHEVN